MLNVVSKVIKSVFGDKSEKEMKESLPIVKKVNEQFAAFQSLTDTELRDKSFEFKTRISDFVQSETEKVAKMKVDVEGLPETEIDQKEAIFAEIDAIEKEIDTKIEEILDEILPEAFAVVKETARRWSENGSLRVSAMQHDRDKAAVSPAVVIEGDEAIWANKWDAAGTEVEWNMVHYDVQLIGGYALHKGRVAEMQTGEGKTLVATLPMYLNALAQRGVHLVTVNDYLARRDCEWMGPLFEFHGLTVDCIDYHQPNSEDRIKAYQANITYGTNNEFGFDYLRDNMTSDPEAVVQKKHHYAIVDEVDSVLIDDARTPLIISGPTPKGDEHQFDELRPRVGSLVQAQRTLVTNLLAETKKALSNPNLDKKEQEAAALGLFRCFRGLPKNKALIKFLSEDGMKSVLQKTENFYLQDQGKKMPEVDQELFFIIDEKTNSIELTDKGVELISGKDNPDLFVLPDVGSAMVELEKTDLPEEEMLKAKEGVMADFSEKSERIHTINQLLKAYCLFEKDIEYVVMDNKVKIVDEQTGRIMEGRRYSDGLHQAIESKENVVIEAATQTYATITLQNYFRMYHKLSGMTGTAETEAGELWDIYKLDVMVIPTNRPILRDDKEDFVYKTKREKYNAIIEEIEGLQNAGRPVLVGTTSVEVSELLSRMLTMKKVKHNVLNAKLHQREADIVAEAGKGGTVTIATNMAGRGTDIKLSAEVKAAGGLAIIGSEKHDSRRVDRQLRGRAGRQGDPGSSQFYVSLEDNLMRMFGSDRVAGLMDKMGLKEGEVIQARMITKSIERAQRKVEENNFGIRKRLLEYDDVMNAQREVIYKRRRHALYGERLKLDVANMFYDSAEDIVRDYHDFKDFEGFKLAVFGTFGIQSPFSEQEFLEGKQPQLAHVLFEKGASHYQAKSKSIALQTFPVIKDIYEKNTHYKNIVIPFTDGKKSLQIVTNLEKSYASQGLDVQNSVEKSVTLAIIDNAWKEHLRAMDELRTSVQNATYEQKDPLLIYKFESFELFKKMIQRVNNEIVSFLCKAGLPVNPNAQGSQQSDLTGNSGNKKAIESKGNSAGSSASGAPAPAQKPEQVPVKADPKVGRNDACPCGSGKKYKQCHGKS